MDLSKLIKNGWNTRAKSKSEFVGKSSGKTMVAAHQKSKCALS
jgi:hypothetical protein